MPAPAPATTPTVETLTGLDDVLALAELHRPGWATRLVELRRSGVPMNDGEAADPPADDTAGAAGDPPADPPADDDDTDDEPDDLAAARKALAKHRRELKDLKAAKAKDEAKAKASEGKYRELYEEELAKREAADAEREKSRRSAFVTAAGTRLKAHDVDDLVAILGADALEDIDSAADAERELKRLRKRKPHLFAADGPRQVRNGGRAGADDDDADDDAPKKKRPPVSTLRRGLEAAQAARSGTTT